MALKELIMVDTRVELLSPHFEGDKDRYFESRKEKKVAGISLLIRYALRYQFLAWQRLFFTLIAGKS